MATPGAETGQPPQAAGDHGGGESPGAASAAASAPAGAPTAPSLTPELVLGKLAEAVTQLDSSFKQRFA